MVKLIDAAQPLSVQVHPTDDYKPGEYGKTEMWYIIEADKGASILYGFNKDISKSEISDRIQNNTLIEVLNAIPVEKGNSFFVEAGVVHAIGKGVVVAEVQQNSNSTYRLYDYGRVDKDGKQRQLHIEDALNVAVLNKTNIPAMPAAEHCEGYKKSKLASCKYFVVYKYEVFDKVNLSIGSDSFNSITITEGNGYFECEGVKYQFSRGNSFFMPANLGNCTAYGNFTFLLTAL
ncbi:MAG: class I mannose-6-phosphate isomerase [Firmicutes bacterium]|nr:class I mannose-6-phosphate isomerase [Bacillota bacterium]